MMQWQIRFLTQCSTASPSNSSSNSPSEKHLCNLLLVRLRKVVTFMMVIVVMIMTGCSSAPDLSGLYSNKAWRLYEEGQEAQAVVQPPVIVVPGIVSSTLVDEQGNEVWFGPWYRALFSTFSHMALEIDETTLEPKPSPFRAGTLPDKALIFDFYGSLFDVLEQYGNYQLTELGTPYKDKERRYYKFPYDWRYDTLDSVKELDTMIEQIRKDYGQPDLKVDVIAHSMGGLLARYYMRYGTKDVLDDNDFPVTQAGAKKVRRLIQLGAPNLGSLPALHQLINGYKVVFRTIPVEVIATMPSIYQLLPHPLNTWLVTAEGKPLERDLFDTENWRRLEWGLFDPENIARIKSQYPTEAEGQQRVDLLQRYFEKHIERARRFVWSLTVPVPDLSYSIIAFGGNCEPTPARMVVEDIDGQSHFRLWPKEVKNKVPGVDYEQLMLEPGDGRVTKPSMLARHYLNPSLPRHKYSFFPLDYAFFLCHNHGQLTGNINFQDNLLNVLLERRRDEVSGDEVDTMMGHK